MTDTASVRLRPRPVLLSLFLNPYVQILLGAALNTAAEVMLKKGAMAAPHVGGLIGTMGLPPLLVGWTWGGIVTYVLSFISWLHVLRSVPLSIAFPLINVVSVFVPMASQIFLNENVTGRRWTGIALTVIGTLLIVKPLVKAEETL